MKSSMAYKLRESWILLGIIALSVLLRLIAAIYLGDQVVDMPGIADQISYHTLAIRVVGGFGFTFGEPWWPLTPAEAPTAHWSYLYTGFLAFIYIFFGAHPLIARILQAVIVGILQPYLAFLIGRRVFNLQIGLISAGLTAIYPYFVYYSAALMTETFYIVAIMGSLYLAILLSEHLSHVLEGGLQKQILLLSLGLGVNLGITILLRQVILLFIPLLLLWIWWASREKFSKNVVGSLLTIGVVLIVMILPFTVFNYIRFKQFVLLNTNAGYAFFFANHPIYGTHFESILPPGMGSYLDLVPVELRNVGDEALLEKELLRRGLQFVVDDPVRYLLLSISRIPPYFMFWPSKDSNLFSNLTRVVGYGFLLPFMIYGLVRAFIPRPPSSGVSIKSPAFLLVMFVLIYSAIHILTWTLVRYRLPVDAVLIIFAALAFYDLYERVRRLMQADTIRYAESDVSS